MPFELDEQITIKQAEASEAWKAYMAARQDAEQKRSILQQAREDLFKRLREGLPPDEATLALYAALDPLEIYKDEQKLGLRVDEIGKALGALLLKRNSK